MIDPEICQAEIARLRAELAATTKDRDNWKAHAISRGKRLRKTADKLTWIMKELEDEGDRVYFGSSNHADEFKEACAWLDDFRWDKIMGESEDWDLLGALDKARAELAAERQERDDLAEDMKACRDEYAIYRRERDAELAAERERSVELNACLDAYSKCQHELNAALAALRQLVATANDTFRFAEISVDMEEALAAADAVLQQKEAGDE